MADDSDVNIKFGASIDELKSKIGEVQGIFKELTERFALVAAALAGGAAFKEFIDTANEVTGETVRLSKAMGVSGDEAATLRTAIEDVGGTADTYVGAFQRFSRQLANNGDTLRQYGIDVDGVRAGTVSGQEAFDQALKSVATYKAGIDQSQAAQKLFGRSIGDVQTLLKVTPAIMEEARKKVETLNLGISVESVQASKEYKLAMQGVQDILTGVKKTIGEEVIPIFTQSATTMAEYGPAIVEGTKAAIETFVGIYQDMKEVIGVVLDAVGSLVQTVIGTMQQSFGSDGPSAMEVFKNALGIVRAAFIFFRIGFEEIANDVGTALAWLSNRFATAGAVWERVLHFDFSGARSEWQAGMERQAAIIQAGVDKAVLIADKGGDDVGKALNLEGKRDSGTAKRTPYEPPTGTRTFKPVNKEADAENTGRKAIVKASAEAELAIVKQALSDTQAAVDDAYKQGLISTKDYYEESLQLTLGGVDAQLAARRKELDATKGAEQAATKPGEKLKFQAQEVQIAGQIAVLEDQRNEAIVKGAAAYRDAERSRLDALVAFQAASAKLGADDDVAKERATLDQEVALRRISADEKFAIDRKLEDQSYAALVASLTAKAAAVRGTEDEQAKQRQALELEAEAAERNHQGKLTAISNQAELEREKYSIQVQQSVQTSFAALINGFLSGTQKISDVFRQFALNIANTFTNLIAQKFTDQLFNTTGINKAIDQTVDLVTKGIKAIILKFAGGQAAQTQSQAAGAEARTLLNAAELGMVEASEVAKTGAVVAGTETQMLVQEEASAQSILTTAGEAVANIAAKAWEAAASVYASIAAIPYVGPFLAPAAAIAAGAAVLGFASRITSSAGGDARVAADGVRLVHKDETILPTSFSNPLRELLAGWSGQGNNLPLSLPTGALSAVGNVTGAASPSAAQVSQAQQRVGGDTHLHLSLSAIDGPSVEKFFMANGRKVVKALHSQGRNFAGVSAS